ncbi:MAG TPA: asparagine synthetase B, partial [Allosphingosinicella sp.]
MCGIAGLFYVSNPKPVDPKRVRTMTDTLAHRGPDGSGVWTAPGVGLGHRRLSIIDLATGDQPMRSADGRLALSYNGEIYNFREVRGELEGFGHGFRTESDTEVILAAWRQWGPDCLSRFNGMFAFALYDQDQDCLFLARDRLGVKPLYWTTLSDDALVFASELKGLLAHPLLRRSPSHRAIEDYLALGYVPDDSCMVAGVRKLAAGHYLLVRRGRVVPKPVQWWDVDFSNPSRASAGALEEELVERL